MTDSPAAPAAAPDPSAGDPYTGVVRAGGAPDVRELTGLRITKVSVGPMDNNCYLLRCPQTGEQLLIDAANDAERLLELVGGAGLAGVLTTHQHWDHVQGLEAVVRSTGALTYAHPADAPAIPGTTDVLVEEGDLVPVGAARLRAVHLVGHTPGSLALVYEPEGGTAHVFTGDCLFPGGIGNTQQDPTRFTTLLDGVEAKLFGTLQDSTWVYPGHGGDTTLGAERPALATWRERGW